MRGAILSPRPHLTLDIQSVEMFCYAAQDPGWKEQRTTGRVTASPASCPAPQQKPSGCLGTAKVLQKIQFSYSAAISCSNSGDAQCNHPGKRS